MNSQKHSEVMISVRKIVRAINLESKRIENDGLQSFKIIQENEIFKKKRELNGKEKKDTFVENHIQ